MKNKTIDDYLIKTKYTLILYIILSILLLIVNVIVYIKFDLNTSNTLRLFYFMLLLIFNFDIIEVVSNLLIYFNIKKIIYYINNKELNIGNILIWNKSNLFFTDNYIIYIIHNEISCINYEEIEKIYKETNWEIARKKISMNEMLHIILEDDKEFIFLTDNLYFDNQKNNDINEFMINKNSKIKDITDKVLEEKKYDIKGTIIYIISNCITILLLVISYSLYKEYINDKIVVNLLLSLVFFIFTLIAYPKTNYLFKKSDFYNKNKIKVIMILIIFVIVLLCMISE